MGPAYQSDCLVGLLPHCSALWQDRDRHWFTQASHHHSMTQHRALAIVGVWSTFVRLRQNPKLPLEACSSEAVQAALPLGARLSLVSASWPVHNESMTCPSPSGPAIHDPA